MRLITQKQIILAAKAVTGIGTVLDVSDCDVLVLDLRSASSANLTAKLQASIADVVPDFTVPATPANPWDYVQMTPIAGGSALAGATGFVLTGTDGGGLYLVNCAGLKWLTLNITARSAGSLSAFLKGFSTGGGN